MARDQSAETDDTSCHSDEIRQSISGRQEFIGRADSCFGDRTCVTNRRIQRNRRDRSKADYTHGKLEDREARSEDPQSLLALNSYTCCNDPRILTESYLGSL